MGVNKTGKPTASVLARRRNAGKRRTSIIGGGGRRIELLLLADAAQVLAELQASTGKSATGVISDLLLQSGKSAG